MRHNSLILLLLTSLSGCFQSWIPTGDWQAYNKAECDASVIGEEILALGDDLKAQSQVVDRYFKRCGSHLARDGRGRLGAMIQDTTMDYDIRSVRGYQKLPIKGFDGITIPGHLFLKDGVRPLVITQCGLQCDENFDGVMRFFDEGPFHVLLLPSSSGAAFQKSNGTIRLGGFQEGRQVMEAARFIQSRAFEHAPKISRVFVFGKSLGSQASLFAAYYNSYVRQPDGRPYIDSFFVGCPVVRLEASVRTLYRSSLLGNHLHDKFWLQMRDVAPYLPDELKQVIAKHERQPKIHENGNFIELLGWTAHQAWRKNHPVPVFGPGWGLDPLATAEPKSIKEIWELNEFQRVAADVKSPVFVWAPQNDIMVRHDQNTALLKNLMQNQRDSSFAFLDTPDGNHCNWEPAYGWRVPGTVFRSLMEARSPELKNLKRTHVAKIRFKSFPKSARVGGWVSRRGIKWLAQPGSRTLILRNWVEEPCLDSRARPAVMTKCKRIARMEVDISNLGLSNEDVPQTEAQAQGFTRWLNSNVNIYGKSLGTLKRNENPYQLQWTTYDVTE